MKQVEAKAGDAKSTKKADLAGSGLMFRSKVDAGPTRASSDITSEIASYIEAIRSQKEELLKK